MAPNVRFLVKSATLNLAQAHIASPRSRKSKSRTNKIVDELTQEHASKYLAGFQYDSFHSKLEVSTFAGQLTTPLARLIRASRILKTMADACWMRSDLRRYAIVGMRVLLRASD